MARAGEESADQLYDMHRRLASMMHAHGIHPTSLSADGTETERALQRHIVQAATGSIDFEIVVPETGCTVQYRIPTIYGLPFVITQDSKHAGKTARNQLLTGARVCLSSAPLLSTSASSLLWLSTRLLRSTFEMFTRSTSRTIAQQRVYSRARPSTV